MTYKIFLHPVFLSILLVSPPLSAQHIDRSSGSTLSISNNHRFLQNNDNTPFLWIGGTVWGMSEWMTREEIDLYLDNRKTKGFNIIQVCLFWGKRVEDPIDFTVNPPNAYGFRAFKMPLVLGALEPDIKAGGSASQPNDYWDHVDYVVKAVKDRDMMLAVLPVWGRRYVNGTHGKHSPQLFTPESMKTYGHFLGNRYRSADHIIWVMGGDVKADAGGDFLGYYRAMAEGIAEGVSGIKVKWHKNSEVWNHVIMTYHPDGKPDVNSSTWFHGDPWLDFNMIETHKDQSEVYKAVKHDFILMDPIKPTVMGEPAYEGVQSPSLISDGRDMRRQAYHTFFAGGAGFTYGGYYDSDGRGPLFSPTNDWQNLLDMEGARSMKWVRKICEDQEWPDWQPVNDMIVEGKMEGVLEKVVVRAISAQKYLVYFPDNSPAKIKVPDHWINSHHKSQWYNPKNGQYRSEIKNSKNVNHIEITPPQGWDDAILVLYK